MSESSKNLRITYKGGQGEIVEKKSRFIATVRPVTTEEEATAFISEMKKKYWDARHNCSAFVLGERQEMTRCSDDGEPAGTAGRPMLDVLLKEGITNTAVVVTRYFGGVLLGTGGLVRAYQGAVQEGLRESELLEKRTGCLLEVLTDYAGLGKLQYIFAQKGLNISETEYGADVTLRLMIPQEDKDGIEKLLIEKTNGSVIMEWGDPVTYGLLGDEVILF